MPSNRWDEGNLNNWTMQKFIDEQPKLEIHVPANIGKVVIKNCTLRIERPLKTQVLG